jgi:pSer/pThr/pTyr-binding forkhead associated (FHA) protein
MMKLFFIDGRKKGDSIELSPPGMSIGRELDNDIILEGEGESRYHAKLEIDGKNWKVKDLGSTNGTKLNGTKLIPNEPSDLKEGDKILIGKQTMLFAEKLPVSTDDDVIISDKDKEESSSNKPSVIAIKPPSPMDETIPDATPVESKEKDIDEKSSQSFSDFFEDKEKEKKVTPFSESTDFFGKPNESREEDDDNGKRKHAGILFYVGVLGVTVILIGIFFLVKKHQVNRPVFQQVSVKKHKGAPLLIRYEKQITTKKPTLNIFRYLMEIKNGEVTITRDDLQANYKQKLSRKVEPAQLQDLEDKISETDFMETRQPQAGIPRDGEDKVQSITIAYGKEMNAITVKNSPPPRSFVQAINALEEFSLDVLNIPPISLTPEEMKKSGVSAYRKAKQLFDNYQARNQNLYLSIKYFGLALESLDGFQNIPEYELAYKYKQEAEALLKQEIKKHSFNYERYRQLGDLANAREECKIIMEKKDPTSKAYNKAKAYVIKLDQLIKKQRK